MTRPIREPLGEIEVLLHEEDGQAQLRRDAADRKAEVARTAHETKSVDVGFVVVAVTAAAAIGGGQKGEADEVASNPRARSAVLRVAEKLEVAA